MEPYARTWYVRLTDGQSFPFFRTTRRDHTAAQLFDLMPKKGADSYLIPVVGGVPAGLADRTEHHRSKAFVSVLQSEVLDMWFEDDLPPARHLRLFDSIQAITTESA